MEKVVAGSTLAVTVATGAAAVDPPAPAVGHPSQLGDINVDQLAGMVALVAHRRASGTVQIGQPRQAVAAQDRVHRRARHPQPGSQLMRAQLGRRPQRQHPRLDRHRRATRAGVRPARPVRQPRLPLGSPAAQPTVRTPRRNALHHRGLRHRIAQPGHPLDQQRTPKHRQLASTLHRESLLARVLRQNWAGGSLNRTHERSTWEPHLGVRGAARLSAWASGDAALTPCGVDARRPRSGRLQTGGP